MPDKHKEKNKQNNSLYAKDKISVRFRNANIAIFALIILLMALAMLSAFNGIITQVSTNYAKRHAISSANILSAHIYREVSLMSKAARSTAVVDWLADEYNDDKKLYAYDELSGIIGELYSTNLYVGLENSRNEYRVEEDYTLDSIRPFATLDENNPQDSWYFECISSDSDYVISIGIDRVLNRKRVWLDYKVEQDGVVLGLICTGLEFSHIARDLFPYYENDGMRGLIIDDNGTVYIDSLLLDDDDFLRQDFENQIDHILADPAFLSVVNEYLGGAGGFNEPVTKPVFINISSGSYNYATIAPIRYTNWSSVILYESISSLNLSQFIPIFAILILLLIAFALAINTISNRLIFKPLEYLLQSLEQMKETQNEGAIYGVERDDEFGDLSNTVQDLFTKANYDALTGIYNRRFMENNLQRIMDFLSRSNGELSMLMIDVDYFKKFNDTYGHEKGDVCLKLIAQAINSCITRTDDFAARYGGEEFVIVLPNTDKTGAFMITDKLVENVRMLNIPHDNSDVSKHVTVSIGITSGKVSYLQNWEAYLKRADEAMYISKQGGRNRYSYLDLN